MSHSRLGLCLLVLSVAASAAPQCYDGGEALPANNAQVLRWKTTTENQFLARGHIRGTLLTQYRHVGSGRSSHTHFSVQIGSSARDSIEIVYNDEFGELPRLRRGMKVEACGDYITASEQAGHYPPSPDGAIVHWTHVNPNGGNHEDGYVEIDGKLYGQDVR